MHERLKGHQSAEVLQHLEATQWWSRDRLEAYRVERLRRLLKAASTVPYDRRVFRGLGFDPAAIRDVAENRAVAARYRRVLRHRPHKKANVAVAHSLLVTAYRVLARQTTYQELGAHYCDRRYTERVTRRAVQTLD